MEVAGVKGPERAEAVRRLEDVVEKLVEVGFDIEELSTTDKEGEPFRAIIRVRRHADSALGGVL